MKVYKKQFIIESYRDQFEFIGLKENDTLVDIGAGSGWYEGAMSVALPFSNLTFYLVDIDSNCLNKNKVNNVLVHYSAVKGENITNNFTIINNTPDSLWLPLNHFKKVCILNTMHEIPDQNKMARDIFNILQPGGEVFVLEMIPSKPNELHGGCHKPLMTSDQLNTIFYKNGFIDYGFAVFGQGNRSTFKMIRYVKKH